jgi:hypothetical protein
MPGFMSEPPLENISTTWALEDLNVQDNGVVPRGMSEIDSTYILNRAIPNPPKQPSRRINLRRQEMNALLCFISITLAFLAGKREKLLGKIPHAL